MVCLAAVPLVASPQRTGVSFIGFLNIGSPNERAHLVNAFRTGLRESGYIDGKDVAIEYRWAEGRYERLPSLAQELVDRNVAVIVATGSVASALAAKKATKTIPIVFTGGDDPVKVGLVSSLSKPGGNLTGIVNISTSLDEKRLQILHELLPRSSRIGYLLNPDAPLIDARLRSFEAVAKAENMHLSVFSARTEEELEAAFRTMKERKIHALVVAANALFVTRRERIVALASRHGIPASYPFREFAKAGGLMSYGPDISDVYRQAGVYASRILKGAKPADLPVIQATKFELILNLQTAKALGLTVPRDFLARVDEVIQ